MISKKEDNCHQIEKENDRAEGFYVSQFRKVLNEFVNQFSNVLN